MDSQGHQHSHSHSHHHSHSHAHSHGGSVGRMKLAFVLNLSFAVVELIGGWLTNSVAIMSGALHDFGDAIAMVIAIVMEKVSHRESDQSFSYGYRRFSTLGAVITGMILMVGSLLILVRAAPRLLSPEQPHENGMIALAVLGLAVNGYGAIKVSKGASLNEKMLMWHMIEDVLSWVLVLLGAVAMKFVQLPQLDAGMAIILALWILYNVFRNLQEAMKVFLMASPAGFDIEKIREEIKKIPLVQDIHHAHLWSLDGQNHILTAHLVLTAEVTHIQIEEVKASVKKRTHALGIYEATLETELQGSPCADPSHPVPKND